MEEQYVTKLNGYIIKDDNAVRKSGDTIAGSLTITKTNDQDTPLYINTQVSGAYIGFQKSGATAGYIGVDSTHKHPVFYKYDDNGKNGRNYNLVLEDDIEKLILGTDAMVFKEVLNDPTKIPAEHSIGDTYKINTKGTYAGHSCEVGDLLICIENGKSEKDEHWTVAHTNTDGLVSGPGAGSTADGGIAVFCDSSGKTIKQSDFTIAASVPGDAEFTDTWKQNTIDQEGYVTAPTKDNANKVWKTDADGKPGWRDEGKGGGTADAVAWENVTGTDNVVLTNTEQTITGLKTFDNKLKIGDCTLIYESGCLKFTFN